MAQVRVIAINPKYRTLPFFCVPVFDENKREYNTGQQHMTQEELAKEPVIIDPENQYPIKHMQKFNTNIRKDAIMLHIISTQQEVAERSSKVKPSQHLFYIENLEEEAGERITKMDKFFEAMNKVKSNTSLGKQNDIAVYLGISTDQPASVIQDRIYNMCQDEPDEVLDFFKPENAAKVFARKLMSRGIIEKRDGKYIDGEIFIGRDETEVLHFLQDKANDSLIAKWSIKLEKLEGKPVVQSAPVPPTKKDTGPDASIDNIDDKKKSDAEPEGEDVSSEGDSEKKEPEKKEPAKAPKPAAKATAAKPK